MPNTKISAATAVATPAGTDEYATNQAGASKRTTLAQVKTFVNTDPDIAAGSATAGTWPNLASGTLLTTAEAGAIERDAECFYLTSDAGNRGVVPIRHFIRANATRTFPEDTNENAIFDSPANGTLTLEAGTYLFKGLIAITAMSATSGNGVFDVVGAGTATSGAWLYQVVGADTTSLFGGPYNWSGTMSITAQTPVSVAATGTGTAVGFFVNGTFEVTVAGTIIPSFTLTTAIATAVVSIGSFMTFERIGTIDVVSVGQWS